MAKLELCNDTYAFKYFSFIGMVCGQLKLSIRRIFQQLELQTLKLKNMVNSLVLFYCHKKRGVLQYLGVLEGMRAERQ